jgi:hypothetical protein
VIFVSFVVQSAVHHEDHEGHEGVSEQLTDFLKDNVSAGGPAFRLSHPARIHSFAGPESQCFQKNKSLLRQNSLDGLRRSAAFPALCPSMRSALAQFL